MKGFYEMIRDKHECIYFNSGENLCEPHFHKQPEILYILQGQVEVRINNTVKTLEENGIAISDCYDIHSYKKIIPHKTFVTVIPQIYTDDFMKYKKELTFENNFIEPDVSNVKILDILNNLRAATDFLQIKGLCNLLFYEIIARLPLKTSVKGNEDNIKEILIYIDGNYDSEITLSRLAKHFGYSPAHFSYIFNKNLGLGINEYLNVVRLNKLITLKSFRPDDSMLSLALEVGFSSAPTFYRAFNRQYGMAPEKFFKKQ